MRRITSRLGFGRSGLAVLAAVAVCAASACASSQGSVEASGPAALLSALVRAGAPGTVALVARDGRVHTYAAGLADVQSHQPMRASLPFRVGSLAKPVVAALVLGLVAERRLQLSDTVAHWLPGLLPDGRQITVLELLQQRSGLPDYLGSAQLYAPLLAGKTPLDYVWTPHQLLRLVTKQPRLFTPGTRFSYSNTNYVVLGLIIERVTHASLQKYAERTLFAPLGMHSTSFALGRLRGPHAHGYLPFVGPFLRAPGGLGDVDALNGSEYAAAASLVSTARDLERFFVALFSGKVIPRSLVALMQATRPDESGPDYQRYGAGLEGSRYQCGMAWGHGGVVYGYRAVVRASRNAHTVIVLLVNHDYDYASSGLVKAMNATAAALYCAG
jgi:D-alanyl-D-alanine carboxypeptidase